MSARHGHRKKKRKRDAYGGVPILLDDDELHLDIARVHARCEPAWRLGEVGHGELRGGGVV